MRQIKKIKSCTWGSFLKFRNLVNNLKIPLTFLCCYLVYFYCVEKDMLVFFQLCPELGEEALSTFLNVSYLKAVVSSISDPVCVPSLVVQTAGDGAAKKGK